MAENTVVVLKEQLTEEMIEVGAELTGKLDEMGLPISAAFWFFLPESNQWRLFFASPLFATSGPRKFYEKIEEARQELGEKAKRVPLSAIGVSSANNQLVELFRIALGVRQGISRIRFSENAVNGHIIDDALIYRLAA